MSDETLPIARSLFTHELWREPRAFSRAEAWIDLLAQAATKGGKTMIPGVPVELLAGGIVTSERRLSERWGWGRTKTSGFIALLVDQKMMSVSDTKPATQFKAFLLCNFGKFNGSASHPSTTPAPPPRHPRTAGVKDTLPTTPEATAVALLFSRRLSTPWTDGERSTFRELRRRGVLTVESMELIGRYYAAERAKGDDGHHRRDLPTFLNNFDGELDRATQSRAGREVRKAKAAPEEPEGWRVKLAAMYPEAKAPASFYGLPDGIQTEILRK